MFPRFALYYLPTLRSIGITHSHHYYGRLSHPYSISKRLAFYSLAFEYFRSPEKSLRASQVSTHNSMYSPAFATPVIDTLWFRQRVPPSVCCLLPWLEHRLLRLALFRGHHVHFIPARYISPPTFHSLSITLRGARLATQQS